MTTVFPMVIIRSGSIPPYRGQNVISLFQSEPDFTGKDIDNDFPTSIGSIQSVKI
jgi:hypothetical protein